MLKIETAVLAQSMKEYTPPTPALAQIALAGRSNVGKSSLINSLCQKKALARVGSEPGKTRLINFFSVNGAFYLVDLPGYGYAKASKEEKARWGRMMEGYFSESDALKGVLHLLDIRHEPTADDIQMNRYLRERQIPYFVIATKADKISRGARLKNLAPICRAMQVQPWQVLVFSAEKG